MRTIPTRKLTTWLLVALLAGGSVHPALHAAIRQAEPVPAGPASAERYPGAVWQRYASVVDTGFSPEGLDEALDFGERRGAVAVMVVLHGAVVVARGDIARRFQVHSIRKSLLSALYGAYQGDIDLTRTLSQLGVDDEPPLTDAEKQARVVDLISARSGVYHPAAGEAAEMTAAKPARGSHAPGTFWSYNNWDFNAAGVVFERLTGTSVFTAFNTGIATPIGMEDYRPADGFYHLEPALSRLPSFGLRMSTRDLARFGVLFARRGRWKTTQVLPAEWVEESTRSHSRIDLGSEYGTGYGYMWWVDGTRGFAARGFGGHALVVYPDDDLVVVVRADTYHDRFLSARSIERLSQRIRRARQSPARAGAGLVPLERASALPAAGTPPGDLASVTGTLTLESGDRVTIGRDDAGLTIDYGRGVFHLVPAGGGRFLTEDSGDPVVIERSPDGRVQRVLTEPVIYLEAAGAARRGDPTRAVAWVRTAVETFPDSPDAHYNLARALEGTGHRAEAMGELQRAITLDRGHRAAAALLSNLRWRRFGPPGVGLLLVIGLLTWWARRRGKRGAPGAYP
ncbi:MAG: serine hydrolase [Vicinamibacterales bacterium]